MLSKEYGRGFLGEAERKSDQSKDCRQKVSKKTAVMEGSATMRRQCPNSNEEAGPSHMEPD